jgi:hypothetical protein
VQREIGLGDKETEKLESDSTVLGCRQGHGKRTLRAEPMCDASAESARFVNGRSSRVDGLEIMRISAKHR